MTKRVWTTDDDGTPSHWEEPIGGSQPVTVTWTAAEVAARWDTDRSAAEMPITALTDADAVAGVFVVANDLDSGDLDSLVAYTPGATTAEVYDGCDPLAAKVAINAEGGGFASALTYQFPNSNTNAGQLRAGGGAYAQISGDPTPPATGSITLQVSRFA